MILRTHPKPPDIRAAFHASVSAHTAMKLFSTLSSNAAHTPRADGLSQHYLRIAHMTFSLSAEAGGVGPTCGSCTTFSGPSSTSVVANGLELASQSLRLCRRRSTPCGKRHEERKNNFQAAGRGRGRCSAPLPLHCFSDPAWRCLWAPLGDIPSARGAGMQCCVGVPVSQELNLCPLGWFSSHALAYLPIYTYFIYIYIYI